MANYRVLVGNYVVDVKTSQTGNLGLNEVKNLLVQAGTGLKFSPFDSEGAVSNILKLNADSKLKSIHNPGPTTDLANQLRFTSDGWNYQVYVYTPDGSKQLLKSSLATFNPGRDMPSQLSQLVGKLVRFNYSGGSTPGAKRLVKVTKYEPGEVYAHDMVSNETRHFKERYISNLEVVNV